MAKEEEERQNRGRRIMLLAGFLLLSVILWLGVSVAPAGAASAPSVITYQGKILASGTAVTTTKAVAFLLYNSLTGGTLLYTASGTLGSTTTVNVTPNSGLFTVNLGDGSTTNVLDASIFQNNASVYLEVIVAGETLSPRKQITAAPYAFNAVYLDGVGATSTASTSAYIPVSASDGSFNFNTTTFNYRVGIGTTSPRSVLDLNTYYFPNADGTSNQVLKTNGSGQVTWGTTSGITDGEFAGELTVWNGSAWSPTDKVSIDTTNGYLGINSRAPGNYFQINSGYNLGSGTITVTNGSDVVVGDSTAFDTELESDDEIYIAGYGAGRVSSIASSTELTLAAVWSGSSTSSAAYYYNQKITWLNNDGSFYVNQPSSLASDLFNITFGSIGSGTNSGKAMVINNYSDGSSISTGEGLSAFYANVISDDVGSGNGIGGFATKITSSGSDDAASYLFGYRANLDNGLSSPSTHKIAFWPTGDGWDYTIGSDKALNFATFGTADITIQITTSTSGAGQDINIIAATGNGMSDNGGNIYITPGAAGGISAVDGNILLAYDENGAAARGKVGVGTSTPAATLNVYGTGNLLQVGTSTDDNLLTFDDTGTLQIGTSTWGNLGAQIVVRGGIASLGEGASSASLDLLEDSNNTASLTWNAENNYATFKTKEGGTDYGDTLVLKTGKVGIGTTTPDSGLSIYGGSNLLRIASSTNDALLLLDDRGTLQIGTSSAGGYGFGVVAAGSILAAVKDGGGDISLLATADGQNYGAMTWLVEEKYFSIYTEESDVKYDNTMVLKTGNVGIGTTTPAYALSVSGTPQFTGVAGSNANDYVCVDINGMLSSKATACIGSSARELKDNIQDLDTSVDAILSLQPRIYIRKSNGQEEVGLIADEVAPIIPRMAAYDETGRLYGVEYGQLPIYLLKVAKEQQAQIESLQLALNNVNGGQPATIITQPLISGVGDLTVVGNFKAIQNLKVNGQVYFNEDTVGRAEILAGATRVSVQFSTPYTYAPVVTLAIIGAQPVYYGVENSAPTGFDIVISAPLDHDVVFNWHAFGTGKLKMFMSDGQMEVIYDENAPPVDVDNNLNLAPESENIDTVADDEQPPPETSDIDMENNGGITTVDTVSSTPVDLNGDEVLIEDSVSSTVGGATEPAAEPPVPEIISPAGDDSSSSTPSSTPATES